LYDELKGKRFSRKDKPVTYTGVDIHLPIWYGTSKTDVSFRTHSSHACFIRILTRTQSQFIHSPSNSFFCVPHMHILKVGPSFSFQVTSQLFLVSCVTISENNQHILHLYVCACGILDVKRLLQTRSFTAL
jgi:hypothetical protein